MPARTISSKSSIANLSAEQTASPAAAPASTTPFNSETSPFIVPQSFQFHAAAHNHQHVMSFAASPADFAYLHLELISNSSISKPSSSYQLTHKHIDLDLICWKIIVTKALSQYLGLSGDAVQADIIHIINPQHIYNRSKSVIVPTPVSKRKRPQRRFLPSNGSQSSLSDLSDAEPRSIAHYYRTRRSSTSSNTSIKTTDSTDDASSSNSTIQNPQVWIRVPEQELTNAWTALSGFVTSIDTGNYGTLNVGIRVIRASRYLSSLTGPLRSKW